MQRKSDAEVSDISWEDRKLGFNNNPKDQKTYLAAEFILEPMPDPSRDDPWDEPGVALQKSSIQLGVTQFLRIEDGAWDPRAEHHHDFYFVTTDKYNGNSRLFRIRFADLLHPEAGGKIEILLEGQQPDGKDHLFQNLDSITVDPWGRVLLQEDSGDNSWLSRTLVYEIESKRLYCATEANPKLFGEKSDPQHITQDEESSGVIPIFDLLGEGWYLTSLQAHGSFPDWILRGIGVTSPGYLNEVKKELVEPGQLLTLFIPKDLSTLPSLFDPENDRSPKYVKG